MSLQDEMTAAAQEYAHRLDQRREAERLAALTLEARREGNAAAFAEVFERALAKSDDD